MSSGQCWNGDRGWGRGKDKYKEKENVLFRDIKTSAIRIKGKTQWSRDVHCILRG